MAGMAWLLAAVAAVPSSQEGTDLREALRDPAKVFPAFQGLMEAGLYTKAYNVCLSAGAHRAVSAEEFQIAFSAFEAARRLVASFRVHAVDAAAGTIRVCSPEFGASRELKLGRLRTIYLLDLDAEDIEYFRGRTLSWFRLQVRRADGWHFAYPPDWSYAPLARECGCKR